MQFNFIVTETYSSENVLYARKDKILRSTLSMQSYIGFTNRQEKEYRQKV